MKQFAAFVLLCFSVSVQADETAPDFSLPVLDSEPLALSDMLGKVVYLDFWASWCGPCKISFADMEQLNQEFSDEDFRILAVSVDDNEADVRRFLRRFDVSFDILLDTSGEVAGTYDLPAMPTTYIIDRRGTVRHTHVGYRPGDIDTMRKLIKEVLSNEI